MRNHDMGSIRDNGTGIIDHIDAPDDIRKRLYGYGFMEGCEVLVLYNKGNAMIVRVGNSKIALENKLASKIFLRTA
ncbi:MAG: FeoA family protein [Clostridia bacterium]